jgi:hypothetical protein
VLGGGLYGGVIGMVAGIGSAIVAETTGKDPGEHVLAMLTGSGDETPAPAGSTAVAGATPPATPPTTAPAAQAALAPASPPSAPAAPAATPTTTAMAEPAAAGEVLMPAARAAAPAQRRLGEPEARSFPVPKRTAGLLPKPVPMVAPGPAGHIDKTPVQRAAAQLASEWASTKPTASQAQAQYQGEARTLGQEQGQTAAWPPGGSAKVPPELVADMMMSALDKYKQGARTGTASMANSGANGVGAARGAY